MSKYFICGKSSKQGGADDGSHNDANTSMNEDNQNTIDVKSNEIYSVKNILSDDSPRESAVAVLKNGDTIEVEVCETEKKSWAFRISDPIVIIHFYTDNIITGLDYVNQLTPLIELPHWLAVGASYPVNIEDFKRCLMTYYSSLSCGIMYKDFCLCPNTVSDVINIGILIGTLCHDRFSIAMANAAQGPLGKVFTITDTTSKLVGKAVNILKFGLPENQMQPYV